MAGSRRAFPRTPPHPKRSTSLRGISRPGATIQIAQRRAAAGPQYATLQVLERGGAESGFRDGPLPPRAAAGSSPLGGLLGKPDRRGCCPTTRVLYFECSGGEHMAILDKKTIQRLATLYALSLWSRGAYGPVRLQKTLFFADKNNEAGLAAFHVQEVLFGAIQRRTCGIAQRSSRDGKNQIAV